jgi:aspartate aminotransferase-like enzyme
MQKIIGGEFDIDISQIGTQYDFNTAHIYSSGRAALYHILILLVSEGKFAKVLLPDYLCESVVEAVKKSNIDLEFYQINYDLSIDIENLQSKLTSSSIVLLINYFGCVDIAQQIKMVRSINAKACIISDNVQGFYAMPQTVESDFSFTSFRKIFAVPDGALVATSRSGLENANDENTFVANKIAGGVLKHRSKEVAMDDSLYLNFLNNGERLIDENYNSRASEFSKLLFGGLNLEAIGKRRKQNATYVLKGLKEMGLEPLFSNFENYVPLFVPIRLENRDAIRKQMFSKNIFCPIHWPSPAGFDLARRTELAKSELSLIVDQRYDENDMQRMLDILKKFQ